MCATDGRNRLTELADGKLATASPLSFCFWHRFPHLQRACCIRTLLVISVAGRAPGTLRDLLFPSKSSPTINRPCNCNRSGSGGCPKAQSTEKLAASGLRTASIMANDLGSVFHSLVRGVLEMGLLQCHDRAIITTINTRLDLVPT